MSTIIRLLLVSGLFLTIDPVMAADPDLAIRARVILRQHCARCHGDEKTHADLNVLDHASMTNTNRIVPAIKAGDPTLSQLIELVQAGSMPPGVNPKLSTREVNDLTAWVAAGAPAFPRVFDDSYVLKQILHDVDRLIDRGEAPANYRYLSLHAPLQVRETLDSLRDHRSRLWTALSSLSPKPIESLPAIDPANVIYRLDLRDFNWHTGKFREVKGFTDEGELDLAESFQITPWDMLLLENPYGRDYGNQTYADLRDRFLTAADQVRPVAFLRGDWVPVVLQDKTIFQELALVSGLPEREPPSQGSVPDAPATPLPEGARTFAPINARSQPNHVVEGPAHDPIAEFSTLDAVKTKQTDQPVRVKTFDPTKDELWFLLETKEKPQVYVEILVIAENGELVPLRFNRAVSGGGGPSFLGLDSGEALEFDPESSGTQQAILFACREKFDPGRHFHFEDQTGRAIERYIHICPTTPTGSALPLKAGLVKRTITFELKTVD